MVQLAKSDTSFKIIDTKVIQSIGLYGPGNDIELGIHNLCTRVSWIAQRSDVQKNNGYDNYTNQYSSLPVNFFQNINPWYSTGKLLLPNISAPNIVVDGTILLDGAQRFGTKTYDFFSLLQNYKHQTGLPIEGVFSYSFAIDHTNQPSGHLNGSMFNKTILRLNLQLPPLSVQPDLVTSDCIVKSSVFSNQPVAVQTSRIFQPDQVLRVISKGDLQVYKYTYTVRAYVESYNFLRVTRGIANVVFSS